MKLWRIIWEQMLETHDHSSHTQERVRGQGHWLAGSGPFCSSRGKCKCLVWMELDSSSPAALAWQRLTWTLLLKWWYCHSWDWKTGRKVTGMSCYHTRTNNCWEVSTHKSYLQCRRQSGIWNKYCYYIECIYQKREKKLLELENSKLMVFLLKWVFKKSPMSGAPTHSIWMSMSGARILALSKLPRWSESAARVKNHTWDLLELTPPAGCGFSVQMIHEGQHTKQVNQTMSLHVST